MIYFGYPLDIHGWKPKPKTEPETKPKPEPENRGRKTNTKPETRKTKTRGYPHRTRSAVISTPGAAPAPYSCVRNTVYITVARSSNNSATRCNQLREGSRLWSWKNMAPPAPFYMNLHYHWSS